ncbi:MAG: transposase [Williamsia sp.]|nr:transposase [Williamsia sp.]
MADLIQNYRVSMQGVCKVFRLHRPALCYAPHRRKDRPVRQRIKDIARSRVRYGLRRIHILLRRAAWKDNSKRVYRIYKEEGLDLGSKRPRKDKTAAHRPE